MQIKKSCIVLFSPKQRHKETAQEVMIYELKDTANLMTQHALTQSLNSCSYHAILVILDILSSPSFPSYPSYHLS